MKLLRAQFSGWSEGPISEQRARQEKTARIFRLPKQIQCQKVIAHGVPSEWIKSPDSSSGIILYVHGGAYVLGSVNSHRELIARLVMASKCNSLAINYRLAPENPFPAALEDMIAAYRWLLEEGIDASRIVFAGDSAGGGLAIAALIALRDAGIPLPAGAVCLSPWLDLALSGRSIANNAKLDPILSSKILEGYANYYTGTQETTHPLISPLYADLKGLPPISIHVGTNEILLDDSIRFSKQAQQAGVDINLEIWDEMFHVFQLFSFLPKTPKCMEQISAFISRVHRA